MHDEMAAIFNAGCDARLAGKDYDENPYAQGLQEGPHIQWLRGWLHVDRYWGFDARWPVRRLPPVMPCPISVDAR